MPFMVKHLISASAVTLSLCAAPVLAQNSNVVYVPGTGTGSPPSVQQAYSDSSTAGISAAVQRWKTLSTGRNFSFADYSSFLMAYPDWPENEAMRQSAEKSLTTTAASPAQIVAYFDRLPPLTNDGRAKYAIALDQTGGKSRAQVMAREAWVNGSLNATDEARLYQILGNSLTSADHDARVDRLLWMGATTNAQRWIGMTSSARRPAFEATLATRMSAVDAAVKINAAGNALKNESGLLAARADFLRNNGNSLAARQLLADRGKLVAPPPVAKDWYKILLTHAEGASNDGQADLAYKIASKLDDTLPSGKPIANEDLTTRDRYTSLAWLAGTSAMNRLGRPADAVGMFRRYADAAKSPQTRSKGFYWAARAAAKAGNQSESQRYYDAAAMYYETFHGQLALEALGRPMVKPVATASLPPLPSKLPSTYQAARAATTQLANWKDQNNFLRAISTNAKTEQDYLTAVSLSRSIGRPDLAVIATRAARLEGFNSMVALSFPTVNVPANQEQNWTLIHSIARQESQFDKGAVSHAGARGLMQLMPGTARETAGKISLGYRPEALTVDTEYNIQLGSTYIQRMLTYFNGSYPLAIAAYNAGPGNVNKWLRANGDPRNGSIDIIDWIEKIPLPETKVYVQRVMENMIIYDQMHPEHARIRSATPLSAYLGKSRPG